MDWTAKVWGRTRELVHSPFYSKHELEVLVGGFCSLHYHRQRANRFLILSGVIEIVEMFGPVISRRKLGPENTYDIPSLVPHLFIVHQPGIVIEEYYPDRGGVVARDDIVRIVEGGLVQADKLHELPECLLSTPNLMVRSFGCGL